MRTRPSAGQARRAASRAAIPIVLRSRPRWQNHYSKHHYQKQECATRMMSKLQFWAQRGSPILKMLEYGVPKDTRKVAATRRMLHHIYRFNYPAVMFRRFLNCFRPQAREHVTPGPLLEWTCANGVVAQSGPS